MTKKSATILALVTTFIYLVASVYLMLQQSTNKNFDIDDFNKFQTFMIVELPKILFLFGATIYFLVSIPAMKVDKTTKPTTATPVVDQNTVLLNQLLEQQATLLKQNNITATAPKTVVRKVVRKVPKTTTTKSKTTNKEQK